MAAIVDTVRGQSPDKRQQQIVEVLVDAFRPLIEADPRAFRRKFRTMAADPFAFYRGSACLFYADVVDDEDRWADERTSRVWIQGDLHAENFGTYMDGAGVLVFDVNDFDEAYVGHFTWDLKRLAASLALIGFAKALSDDVIDEMVATVGHSYVEQVREFVTTDRDHEFGLTLGNTEGVLHDVLLNARMATRVDLLDGMTHIEAHERSFRDAPGVIRLSRRERRSVQKAFEAYLGTIPEGKRKDPTSYVVKDIVGRTGFGIGSAGLPAYNILLEGHTQALENDVVLSMKQGNVAAPSRVVQDERLDGFFEHHGHRTALAQRALQAHADPWLGWCTLEEQGQVVQELSPYTEDIDWDLVSEPEEILPLVRYLGQAVAKVHCVSDADSEQIVVDFQTEDAIDAVVGDDTEGLVADLVSFGRGYGEQVRDDHRLFVDAFRNGQVPGVS